MIRLAYFESIHGFWRQVALVLLVFFALVHSNYKVVSTSPHLLLKAEHC